MSLTLNVQSRKHTILYVQLEDFEVLLQSGGLSLRQRCHFLRRKRPSRAQSPSQVSRRSSLGKLRVLALRSAVLRIVNHLHEASTTYTKSQRLTEDASVPHRFVPGKLLLEVLGFQQQAGDVVVLRRVADEEVDFGHEALEHFGRFDRLPSSDRGQQARFAVFRLLGIFRFH